MGANTQPIRVWRPSAKGQIPIGPLTNGPYLTVDAKGAANIYYVVGGVNVVWIAPGEDEPLWVATRPVRVPGDGIMGKPFVVKDRMYLTDTSGVYLVIDTKTGQMPNEPSRLRGNAPAASAIPIDEKSLFAPLSDGTVIIQPVN